MSAKKPNISQIDKYLKGELDARAMHQLERQAQDDPFLMDALEGYENSGKNQQPNLADLKEQLAKRTAPAKQRSLILWRVFPIAATLLLMLGAGYWLLKSPEPAKDKYVYKVTGDNLLTPPPPTIEKQIVIEPKDSKLAEKKTYKTDRTEYIADNHNVRANATVDDILKKTDGVETKPDGSITYRGQAVVGAKLNGKDFSGGNLTSAIQNLPADIVDNLQIADTINKTSLIAANRPAPQLREVSISGPVTVDRSISGKILDQQGAPLIGATVKVDGTGKAVATDVNGNFKIDLPANKDLLAVNYIGYNTQQVKVGNRDNLNIALQNNDNSLNEVVVVGFGVQKKQAVVGSIGCNENLKFKTQFFNHIATVEKYTNDHINATKQTIKIAAYKKAMAFLTKYTKVPGNNTEYKDLSAFKADKDKWLKWYEANNCNNLK